MLRFINVKSRKRNEFIDITSAINAELREAHFTDGICYVYVPHTTAGVTINEGADPSVQYDVQNVLTKLVPKDPTYRHLEGNSDAHVKSSLVGVSLSVPVEEGELSLGTWQAVFFCEFDGPRHRRIHLKLIG